MCCWSKIHNQAVCQRQLLVKLTSSDLKIYYRIVITGHDNNTGVNLKIPFDLKESDTFNIFINPIPELKDILFSSLIVVTSSFAIIGWRSETPFLQKQHLMTRLKPHGQWVSVWNSLMFIKILFTQPSVLTIGNKPPTRRKRCYSKLNTA